MFPGLALCLFACGVDSDDTASAKHTDSATSGGERGTSSSGGADSSETGAARTSGDGTGDATSSGGSTSTGGLDAGTPGTPETTGETGDATTGGDDVVCGDGIVQGGEECDDPGDLHCSNCTRDRLVFVTSQGLWGDWALSGEDYWCNHLAALAGLLTDNQFRFKPWMSTSKTSARDRLFHSPGRYVLVNDLVFAESWDDLVAGNILHPLDVDENGHTQDVPVWTDTAPDGTAVMTPDGENCGDWTDDSLKKFGHYGLSNQVDGGWTMYADPAINPTLCGLTRALYCFESP